MTNEQLLKHIFNGYVICYRKNNWHTSSNYSDMTHAELNFFKDVGQSLGFFIRKEMNWDYPRDLCWCETEKSEAFLYLERENENSRCVSTIEKQLNQLNSGSIPNLVSVFGWITPDTLDVCKDLVRQKLPEDKAFLLISWIGEKKNDGNFLIEGWTFFNRNESKRIAIPEIDKAGYWYLYFSNSSVWS